MPLERWEASPRSLIPMPRSGGGAAAITRGTLLSLGDADASLSPIKKILRAEGLVDEGDHWVGGRRVVAQVGDVVGRGDQAKELYQYLFRLQAEARRAGGEVDPPFWETTKWRCSSMSPWEEF